MLTAEEKAALAYPITEELRLQAARVTAQAEAHAARIDHTPRSLQAIGAHQTLRIGAVRLTLICRHYEDFSVRSLSIEKPKHGPDPEAAQEAVTEYTRVLTAARELLPLFGFTRSVDSDTPPDRIMIGTSTVYLEPYAWGPTTGQHH